MKKILALVMALALVVCASLALAEEVKVMLGLQFFWLIALVLIGSSLCRLAERKACIQGG